MKICIPTINTHLRLTEDWVFPLHHEYRNTSLFTALGVQRDWERWIDGKLFKPDPHTGILRKGTLLSVARIYIRGSFRDFDSLTFKVLESDLRDSKGKPIKGIRFWAKLADVNNIECDIEPTPPKKTRA